MKIKLLFTILALALSIGILSAQKVKLKKGKVFIDKTALFKYEGARLYLDTEMLIYPLDADDEIIFIQYLQKERAFNEDIGYVKITFVNEDLSLESRSHAAAWRHMVEWMARNKIFNSDGSLSREKIEKFVKRYDEKISE